MVVNNVVLADVKNVITMDISISVLPDMEDEDDAMLELVDEGIDIAIDVVVILMLISILDYLFLARSDGTNYLGKRTKM